MILSALQEAGPVDMGGWMAEAESSCEEADDDVRSIHRSLLYVTSYVHTG